MISSKPFGITENGESVTAYTISNKSGMSATVINYGAILTSLIVPDSEGITADVVLGYDILEPYFSNGCYFGSTIGRNANRICNAAFSIDGSEYSLEKNDGENNLHTSDINGFHKRVWEAAPSEDSVLFTLKEDDLANGFPGSVSMKVTYTLSDDNELIIDYSGISDKKTVFNCTNHSYFNLAGHDFGDILGEKVIIYAQSFLPVRPGAIPTGEQRAVDGTPFDFRTPRVVGADIETADEQLILGNGYDHNWCLDNYDGDIRKVAEVIDEGAKRHMEVYTDLPGIQFYTGNFINGEKGKGGAEYGRRAALCLETQYYPDSANQSSFVQPIFEAGQEYKTRTIYKFV